MLCRQELVHRRVEQPHRDRVRRHFLEELYEVVTLKWHQPFERDFAVFLVVGEDHVDDDWQAFNRIEHALGPAQADTHRTVLAGRPGRIRCICIRHDFQVRRLVSPTQ